MSIQAKAGRCGGTYAHKDIAFEFAMWISPEFKIYIVKEFQRLKADEQQFAIHQMSVLEDGDTDGRKLLR